MIEALYILHFSLHYLFVMLFVVCCLFLTFCWYLDQFIVFYRGPPRFEGDRPRFGDRDGYRGGPRGGGDFGGDKGGAPPEFQPSFRVRPLVVIFFDLPLFFWRFKFWFDYFFTLFFLVILGKCHLQLFYLYMYNLVDVLEVYVAYVVIEILDSLVWFNSIAALWSSWCQLNAVTFCVPHN